MAELSASVIISGVVSFGHAPGPNRALQMMMLAPVATAPARPRKSRPNGLTPMRAVTRADLVGVRRVPRRGVGAHEAAVPDTHLALAPVERVHCAE